MSRTDKKLIRPSLARVRRLLPDGSRRLLDAAADAAERSGESLWIVGGAVRDCAAGLPLRDIDLAVEGEVDALAAAVAQGLGGEVRLFPRFGTAIVRAGGHALDLAATRRERYERPGALPTVEPGATIEEDLGRRDFSVNAVALGLTGPRRGEIVDPLGGLHDLAARRLRVLHARSFVDDATRLWRGARYATRLRLRPEPETARLIAGGGRWLDRISGTRLWAECVRTAGERRVWATLQRLDRWGVLTATAPGMQPSPHVARALRHRPGPHDPAVLLAVLLAPLAGRARMLARLGPPREARRAVEDAVRLLALREPSPAALAAAEGTGHAGRTAALWLDPERQRPLQRGLRRWERTRSPLNAGELTALGVPPGPELARWLERLRRQRYLGTLNGAGEARRLVRGAPQEGVAG